MMSLRNLILLAVLPFALGCPTLDSAIEPELAVSFTLEDSAFAFLADRAVHEPQFLLDESGRPLLLWRERSAAESDLYAATLTPDGVFSTPVRVNDEADTVGSYPLDELRAAATTGAGGRVAVAWGDARGQVRVAESRDGGATFAPTRQLEQVEGPAYRSFPGLTYDEAGTLHAVWIDSRFAEGFAEEPADLFYARITTEAIEEHNLTAAQEASVCGCCRPYIDSSAPEIVRIVFRNTTADGYRDVFTIDGGLETGFTAPRRVGPPLWKLRGCPMSGPIVAAEEVLWPDGSTGSKLLRRASFDADTAEIVFDDAETAGWTLGAPPRLVENISGRSTLLLVPGRPHSRLLVREQEGDAWRLAVDELPAWATSAWVSDRTLRLIGAVNGEFFQLEQEFGI